MDHNERDGLEIIEELKEIVQLAVMLASLVGDSEEHMRDCIEKAWREKTCFYRRRCTICCADCLPRDEHGME